ncbi:MAG: branched-chain amino acid ABC transporter substrate-binding protein [Nitriliruptorales bacterium]
MRYRNRFTWLALAMSSVLIMSACGGNGDGAAPGDDGDGAPEPGALGAVELEEGDPIKIATLQAISGEVASLGTDQVRAVEIAIDDFGGEIKGHSIELLEEDDLCSAEGGTTGAQRIVSDPQVIGIIGTSCSGAGVPAAQIASEAGLVMISGSNTSPALTTPDGETQGDAFQEGYYRTAHNDTVQGAAAALFAFEELGVTKAASIHDGDPYTQGLTGVFNQEFEALGGEIVLATAVNKGDTDMRPVLNQVADAGAELIFFPIFQPEGDFIAQQAGDVSGLEEAILMGADGLLSDTFVVIPETQGMYFSGPATPDAFPEAFEESVSAYEDFVASYEEKFGEAPIQSFHAHAYDAATILLTKIDEVAVEDGGRLIIDRQALRDALYETSGSQGLTGTLTCDEFGDCADPKITVVHNDGDAVGDISAVRSNVVFTYQPPS